MKKRPLILIIRDGWGYRRSKNKNAIASGDTKYTDHLMKTYPNILLDASGEAVGLPKGFQGNSEVGHLTIGSGRIPKQALVKIDESIKNGSIEKSHDLFKTAVEQQLILRGSKDFANLEEYKIFLENLVKSRNSFRTDLLLEEQSKLKKLPVDKWYSPEIRPVRVNPQSVIHINKVPYSVPSRLISYTLKAHIYPEKIE